jgi:hypothetical protein
MRILPFICCVVLLALPARAADESLWIEAEHFTGIRGFCWPVGAAEL